MNREEVRNYVQKYWVIPVMVKRLQSYSDDLMVDWSGLKKASEEDLAKTTRDEFLDFIEHIYDLGAQAERERITAGINIIYVQRTMQDGSVDEPHAYRSDINRILSDQSQR